MLQATRPTTRLRLPDNPDAATEATLQIMFDLVDEAKADDLVRQTAAAVVGAGAPAKATGREIEAIFEFVRSWIRYTRDPVGLESVAEPRQVLLQEAGDCDDQAVAAAALLAAVGIESRLVALDFGRGFSHVIVEARVDDGPVDHWVALDTTENEPFGWTPPRVFRRMVIYSQ
jgi:transglutaminase-like putative cysteine protease